MSLTLTILFCCLAVILPLGWLWSVMAEREKRKKRIMEKIGMSEALSDQKADKQAQGMRQKDIAKKLKALGETQESAKKKGKSMRLKIAQAGLSMSVQGFWIRSVIFGVVVAGLAYGAGKSPLLVVLIAVIATLGLPRLFLSMKAARRQKLFLRDFADALEAMVRLLKSGMPVTESISMVAREFTGPLQDEMQQIYESQKVGIPLAEACEKSAQRMPLPEMHMLATGIAIQAQTGSSLSEALQNLANLIRARHRLKRKIVALSSEAKTSAMIIGALPILVGGMLYLVNPDYTGLLFTDPTGKVMITGAAIWMSIGVFVMKAMINFKV